jgi:tRNA U34 2-thiouridine synthase MnmA/TrmU
MIRYRGKSVEAKFRKISDEKILVKFFEPQNSVARGQVLVIYNGSVCLGEGEII